jgi:sulfur relay (sulfurtransferase) DsrC/TusE family protein
MELGLVRRAGHYQDYVIGILDDSVKDIAKYEHLNATILPENVAMGWKFAGNYSGYLSVRANTAANEQLNNIVSSAEEEGVKVKYYLSDDDKSNGAAFMKALLRKILDDVYDKRFTQINLPVSKLEEISWAQQRAEAEAFIADNTAATPLLTSLAQSRGITVNEMANKVIDAITDYNQQVATLLANKQLIETEIKSCAGIEDLNILIHNRFGYNMPAKQQQDLGITTSSTYDL